MAQQSKRSVALRANVDAGKTYPLADAVKLVKKNATAKFDESIDVAVNLGIDAKKSDQLVRGSIVLPQGTGKKVRVAVFAQADKAREAKEAGADIVKIFPSDCVGPGYLKALKGPFPHIRLMPTGGVDVDNAAAFLKAGACALGVGSSLVSKAAVYSGDMAAITAMTKRFVAAVSF